MKSGPDRKYTPEFHDAVVEQVMETGQPVSAVERSLAVSNKSLTNWVGRACKGQEPIEGQSLIKQMTALITTETTTETTTEMPAELSRLRQENARLRPCAPAPDKSADHVRP